MQQNKLDLEQCLQMSEKADIEFKSAKGGVPGSLWETYSAFANTFGGVIVLGVAEPRKGVYEVQGVDNHRKMLSDLWNTLHNSQKVSANILMEQQLYCRKIQGKTLIVMEIPRAERQDRPVYLGRDFFHGTYRRSFEGDYRCSKAEIRAMLRDQAEVSSDSLILEKTDMEVLNQDSIRGYRNLFQILRPDHVWNQLTRDEFLLKIGAARSAVLDGRLHPTRAGLLFFGNFMDIVAEFPNFFLDYRERNEENERWVDRICSGDGDWSGNIFDFYFKIMDRVTSDIRKPFVLDQNMRRQDDTMIHKAVREALANTLIHADYHGRQGVVIEKKFRRLTFANPGLFRVELEDAIAGGVSDARNNRIFNMFSLVKIGERSGMGLCDIFEVWKKNGFPVPKIKESVNPDRCILTLNLESVAEDSVAENSVVEDSVVEDSVVEDSVVEDSVAEDSVAENSVAEESVAEESVAEESVAEDSVAEESVAEDSVAENSVAENSVAEESVAEESVAENSVAEESVAEESVAEESVAENSVAEESVAENSVAEESVAENSVAENSVAENSVAENSVAEASVVEASVVEDSVVEDSVVEESVAEDSVAEDSVVEEINDTMQGTLKDDEKEILRFVSEYGAVVSRGIASGLGMNLRSVQRFLKHLETLSLVCREGSGHNVKWKTAHVGYENSGLGGGMIRESVYEYDYGNIEPEFSDIEAAVLKLLEVKHGFHPEAARKEFLGSRTYLHMRRHENGRGMLGARDYLEIWETERITGNPGNSVHMRRR